MWESGRALSEQAAMKEGDEAKEPSGRREIKIQKDKKELEGKGRDNGRCWKC